MSIEPKKLKAHIGAIKTFLDEIPSSAGSEYLLKCYHLLLITELCQRGVIHPFKNDDNDSSLNISSSSKTKILDVIQSTAGKIMLDENIVPKPLVAGSAVIASMVAEKFADIMIVSCPDSTVLDFLSNDECQAALKRCEDVGDTRFQILLNIGRKSFLEEHCVESSSTMSAGSSDPSQAKIKCSQIVAIMIFRLSMGNILRAASFSNPDQPPMWKRSTDLCVKLHITISNTLRHEEHQLSNKIPNDELYFAYHTSDAIYPLTNLIRIAESKKNVKRVSELSLRLAQSYISNNDHGETLSQFLSDNGLSLWKQISEIFVKESIPSKFQDVKNELNNITNCRKILKKFDEGSSESLRFKVLYQILCVRIEIEHEEFIVKTLAKNRDATAKNRTGIVLSSSSSGSDDKGTLDEIVRRDVLAKSLSEEEANDVIYDGYDANEVDSAASLLQKTMLSSSEDDLQASLQYDMLNAIYDLFTKVIDRLLKKAQAVSLHHKTFMKGKAKKYSQEDVHSMWDSVESFVKPFLNECRDVDTTSISIPSKRETLRKGALAIFTTLWMKQNDHVTNDIVEICTKILAENLQEMKTIEGEKVEQMKRSGENLIQTTDDKKNQLHNTLINWIYLTGSCHSYLSQLSVESKESAADCQKISRAVIKQLPDLHSSSAHLQFGTAYFFFLSCWSGLHRAPWSYCNVTKARSIILLTREKSTGCESVWGRKISSLEWIMMDLGEADAECGFLSGGFTDKAKKLYTDVLSRVEQVDLGNDMKVLIRSHCISGLLMISFSESVHDSQIVENAMVNLNELMSLRGSDTQVTCHRFTNENSLQSSINFHLCQLRTLVAESFIRSAEIEKAEDFLKQAVADSPSNFDAAFALGAFWLRMSFEKSGNELIREEYSKKGQVQLLKSLKLDSTKADPFALLGLWYEAQNDLKRALGCFSKALLINPSHPVAGRGLLRLRKGQDVSKMCNEAVSITSNTNGWAWKTLGDSKVLDDGMDEVAIACYQQALRCRDIEHPQQHVLHVFFVESSSFGTDLNECSQTWAALASCYRRLGKFSASLRAYEFASRVGSNDDFKCAWAQVELELGLFEEAALKFDQVLHNDSSNITASFGVASCSLLLANRKIEDGKFGAALDTLSKGIVSLTPFMNEEHQHFCILKLLGDLYSQGFKIPEGAFSKLHLDISSESKNIEQGYSKQQFLAQGYDVYCKCLERIENNTDITGSDLLVASALSDMATNLMLQAHLQINNNVHLDESTISILSKAKDCYTKAIQLNELDASLWCGLGCSLFHLNQILAQHAFCRAIQLDKNSSDAWANLGFSYADYEKVPECEATIDVLTQVADTPLMWVLRGLVLEKNTSELSNVIHNLQNASDAYRACLQTSKIQSALLGLASTCRRFGFHNNYNETESAIQRDASKESHSSASLYLNFSDTKSYEVTSFLQKVMELENGMDDVECCLFEELVQNVKADHQDSSPPHQPLLNEEFGIDAAQRDVHMNPDNGEAWLKLAKGMLVEFTNLKSPSEQHRRLLMDAVQRANLILKAAITEPVTATPSTPGSLHQSVIIRSVDATLISDAEAISSWVRDQNENNEKRQSSQNLQRALILDPENCLARIKIQ